MSTPEYTAAPAETIDVGKLKSSRFLYVRDGLPDALPYRDESGRIALTLLRTSAAEAETLAPPQPVLQALTKWLKHAEHWYTSSGHTWSKTEAGTWRCDKTGEERHENGKAPPAKEQPSTTVAAAAQTNGASAQRTASRIPPKRPRDVLSDDNDSRDRKVSNKGGVKQQRYGSTGSGKSAGGGEVKLVVKGRAAVDASCPIAATCHVYDEGSSVYDALLNQTNIAANNNK